MSDTSAAKTVVYTYDDLNRLTQAQLTTIGDTTWYDQSWQYRIPITASSSKVLEDTKDVYFNLAAMPSAFFTNAKSDGCDIRITRSDGTTELPIDLVSFRSNSGQLHFSTGNSLSISSSTIFYVYYGNPSASCYAENATYGAQNVYDSSTKGVWHLEESSSVSGAIKDSTSGNHDGTMYSNFSANANGTTTGKLGYAAVLDGSNDTIDIADSTDFEGNAGTIEAWVYMDIYPSTKGEHGTVVSKKHSSAPWSSYALYISGSTNATDGKWADSSGTFGYAGSYSGGVSTGSWHHVVLRHNPADTSSELSVRTNSSNQYTYTANTTGTTYNSNDVLRFGADWAGGDRLDGNLDEIRFHNVARSDNYIATRYNNMSSPSTFWSIGTQATSSQSATTSVETYSYNIIGNLLSKTGQQGTYAYAGTTTGSYANPHAVTSIGGSTYTYDNNGNLLTASGMTNTWDYRNRLTQTVASSTTTYGYDHSDQRVKKTTGGVSTYYPNKYFEITNATSTKYIFAGDELVAYVEGNGMATSTHYVHPDHLGSTNIVTNSLGVLELTKDYYPYGAERLEDGSASLTRGYIGQYEDGDNLSYLNARYYKSDRGQFLSQDPIFLQIGAMDLQAQEGLLRDPQQLNSYSYARNNPIIYKDPTGKCAELVSGTACVLLGTIIVGHALMLIGGLTDNPEMIEAGFGFNSIGTSGGGGLIYTQGQANSLNNRIETSQPSVTITNGNKAVEGTYYRGGNSFDISGRKNQDYKIDNNTGFVTQKLGPSLNTDPYNRNVNNPEKNRSPFEVLSISKGLQIVEGANGHASIVPQKGVNLTQPQFQAALNNTQVRPFNTPQSTPSVRRK
jgi:RHS repeat-associated protein